MLDKFVSIDEQGRTVVEILLESGEQANFLLDTESVEKNGLWAEIEKDFNKLVEMGAFPDEDVRAEMENVIKENK